MEAGELTGSTFSIVDDDLFMENAATNKRVLAGMV